MRILAGFIFLLGMIFFSFYSYAQESSAQELQAVLSPIQSLQADFVQTILDNKERVIQRSEGKLSLQRPGRFRWQVLRPIPQLIIANNTRLWIYDPDLEQVVIRPVAKEIGKTPAFILSNDDTAISQDFIVRRLDAPQNWQWFSLIPKSKASLFQVIQLGFLNHHIKEMRLEDHLGHNTVIQFHHVKENIPIDAALFQFHAPVNVDVIDETR